MIKFEWDQPKATANLKKHQVSFEEAKSVFYDEFAVQFFDEEHSSNEDRFLLLGMSSRSLSDFGIVGCECAAAAHFLPSSCPIAPLWGGESDKNWPRRGALSLSTPKVRQASWGSPLFCGRANSARGEICVP